MKYILSVMLLAFTTLNSNMVRADLLYVLYGDFNPPPFFFKDDNKKVGAGILNDIPTMAATRIGSKVLFIQSSRQRMGQYISSGRADVVCHTHPDWLPNTSSLKFVKTYQSGDVYVVPRVTKLNFKRPHTLKDARVGTIQDFHYNQEFQLAQKSGAVFVPAPIYETNWVKLLSGALDGMIITDILALHQMGNKHFADKFQIVTPDIAKPWRYCAINTNHPDVDDFISAIDDMRENKEIEKIISKYIQ